MKTNQLFKTLLAVIFLFSAAKTSLASGPSTPSTIVVSGGIAKVCPGDYRTYTVTAVAGCTYMWTMPTGLSIQTGQGVNSIYVYVTSNFLVNGTMSVTATNGMGTSAARTLTIARNNPGTPGYITGQITACCASTSHVFTVPAVAGVNYNWTASATEMSIAPGQITNNVTMNTTSTFTSGNLMVNGYNGCGTSGTRTQAIASVPAKPGMISGATYNVCFCTNYYSFAAVANATSYSWSCPGAANVSPTGYDALITFPSSSFSSATISVTANNTCGASAARTLVVYGKPATPASISANPVSWCNGGFVNFSTPTILPQPTFNWTATQGTITAGQGSTNVDVTWGTGSGLMKVSASNTCGTSGTRSVTFTSVCRDAGNDLTDGNFTIYPNPASDLVNISAGGLADDSYTVSVYNLIGQVVSSQTDVSANGSFQSQIDLSNLSTGLYFVTVQSGSFKKVMKIEKN